MGELMRRYWHPVAAVAELDERYQQGQVAEEDYRQQRQGMITRALGDVDEPEDTTGR